MPGIGAVDGSHPTALQWLELASGRRYERWFDASASTPGPDTKIGTSAFSGITPALPQQAEI
jgi:hypothetical protein